MSTYKGGTATGHSLARIQPTGYQAILWCSTALSLPFVFFRLYVRRIVFHKLFIDDGLVVLSWLLLLVYAITQQVFLDDLYVAVNVSTGAVLPDASFPHHFGRFETDSVVSNIVLSFGLWGVKFAFLFFFRRLGTNVRHQRAIWWAIVCFNIACWSIWVGVVDWQCITPPVMVVLTTCNTVENAAFSEASIRVQTAMDVVSDCSIIVIPIILLWKVQIRWRRKLVLGGIFSLTLFTMLASIIRVVLTVDGNAQNDNTWLYGWAALELGVSIIVACLASFRALFTGQTLSQRMPEYNEQVAADNLERRGLARLGLTSFNRSSNSIGRGLAAQEPQLFDASLRHTETYVHAKNGGSRHPSSSRNTLDNDHELADLNGSGKVYIRNEFAVTGESR